jgi:hypothetical protein
LSDQIEQYFEALLRGQATIIFARCSFRFGVAGEFGHLTVHSLIVSLGASAAAPQMRRYSES